MPSSLFELAVKSWKSYLGQGNYLLGLIVTCFFSFSTLYGQLDLYNPEGVSKRMLLVKVGLCLVMGMSAILIPKSIFFRFLV